MKMVITVDGGVATGSSTLAKNLALVLGLPQIDGGSMYRAITYLALDQGVNPNDAVACEQLARNSRLSMPSGEVLSINDIVVVEWIDGQRIDNLHTKRVDEWVSVVSSHKGVRDVIDIQQRKFATAQGAVVDGRDAGTVVFPEADLKLFLVCDDNEAARRRSEADGRIVTIREVQERNEADRKHKFGALKKADDAVQINTTNLEAGEVAQLALELVNMEPPKRPKLIKKEQKTK